MIKLSINVTKINKDRIKPGKNGKYLGLVLFENKEGEDKYGNHGFVKEDVTKEEREAGVQGQILGNWKDTNRSKPKEYTPPARGAQAGGSRRESRDLPPDNEDDCPF